VAHQRVDARFVLPFPVERAVVLGDLEAWNGGLAEVGIDVSATPAPRAAVDLVVAPSGLAGEAIAADAPAVVLEGGGGSRRLRAAGYATRTLLPIPSIDQARHLVRPDHRRAAVYAVEHSSVATTAKRRVRNRVAKTLLSRGLLPGSVPVLTVGVRSPAPPFLLAPAEEYGVPPDADWFMTLGGFDVLSRSVFQLFAHGDKAPRWVVKFTRVSGHTEPLDRDERGVRLVETAGGQVAAHAPRILGRFEAAGLHASVETAAAGYRLTDFMLRPVSRAEKVRVIESVARWIVELGRRTAAAGETLQAERNRLASDVVPLFRQIGIEASLVERLPSLPSVLRHGNLGTWNVIARDQDEFSVIDWETAREHGLPLCDLVFFLGNALLHLDGATAVESRDQHTRRLFLGELPSSEILFRWVRNAVAALDLPPETIGPIVTLCWLDHAADDVARASLPTALGGGTAWGESDSGRVAGLWLREPGLGPDWTSWQGD
jgi:hypothetical protein